jgi:hypothetical protein
LTRSFRAACACRSGYEGDPYTGCRRSECVGKFHSSSIASNYYSIMMKFGHGSNRKHRMPQR